MQKQRNNTKKELKKLGNLTHRTVPATVRLVKEVRSELRSEIRAVSHEVGEFRKEVRGEMAAVEERWSSKFDKLTAEVYRANVLAEEQRAENRIVLDGLKLVLDRQAKLEGAGF